MLKILGLLAGFLFACAAVPQAFLTLKNRKHLGTPSSIIFSVFGGTILMYLYLYLLHGFDWVLALVYGVETLSWGILLFFYLKEKFFR